MAEIPVNFTVRDAADGLTMRADERLTASDARKGRRQRVPHRTVAAFVWLLFWLMTAGGYLIHLLARPDHVRFDEGPPDS